MSELDLTVNNFKTALLQINRIKATEVFSDVFKNDGSFYSLEKLLIKSLEEIGEGWNEGTHSLAQVYMSGLICEELIDEFYPESEMERKSIPKMAIAVLQDHHALGKRMVFSVLRAGGYDLLDFGQGLSPEELVDMAVKNEIEVLLISTLMLHSALKIKEVSDKLKKNNIPIKIIVGGAPFRLDSQLWKAVGADADGKNATDVIKVIEEVILL